MKGGKIHSRYRVMILPGFVTNSPGVPMAREIYAALVALLVHPLPLIAEEKVFALKGGTAINLLACPQRVIRFQC